MQSIPIPKAVHFGGATYKKAEEGSEEKGLLRLECLLDFGDVEVEINPRYRTNNHKIGNSVAELCEGLEEAMKDGDLEREEVARAGMAAAVAFLAPR